MLKLAKKIVRLVRIDAWVMNLGDLLTCLVEISGGILALELQIDAKCEF